MTNAPICRLWPDPDPDPLDDEALTSLYAPADRSRPLLRVNFVTSVDGAVEVEGFSAGLFSAGLSRDADLRIFGLLRMTCDALLVGAGTLRHEGYRALRLDERRRAWRRDHGLAEYPTLVIVSGALELAPSNPALAEAPVRPIVLTHASAPVDRRAALEPVADVLTAGDDEVDLAAGVSRLTERGLPQVLCEGGPHLFGALAAAGVVDEVCLTLSPLLAGAGAGRIVAGPTAPPHRLALGHVLASADVLLLRYTHP
jgi:riboflavin biosynthesis pyrimidine reductase